MQGVLCFACCRSARPPWSLIPCALQKHPAVNNNKPHQALQRSVCLIKLCYASSVRIGYEGKYTRDTKCNLEVDMEVHIKLSKESRRFEKTSDLAKCDQSDCERNSLLARAYSSKMKTNCRKG